MGLSHPLWQVPCHAGIAQHCDDKGKNERDVLLTLQPGLRGPHRHSQLSLLPPKMLPLLNLGSGVGDLLCRRGCWGPDASSLPQPVLGGPPRGSFLVSSVVTSPTGEAPGVPDTQSTTWGTV